MQVSRVSRAGLRAPALRQPKVSARRPLVCRADAGYIGSSTNVIMVLSTGLVLAAGRFGLAPTVRKQATAGLKLVDSNKQAAGVLTRDPAGFTVTDVLTLGAVGHIIGVGTVLGLRAIGAI